MFLIHLLLQVFLSFDVWVKLRIIIIIRLLPEQSYLYTCFSSLDQTFICSDRCKHAASSETRCRFISSLGLRRSWPPGDRWADVEHGTPTYQVSSFTGHDEAGQTGSGGSGSGSTRCRVSTKKSDPSGPDSVWLDSFGFPKRVPTWRQKMDPTQSSCFAQESTAGERPEIHRVYVRKRHKLSDLELSLVWVLVLRTCSCV